MSNLLEEKQAWKEEKIELKLKFEAITNRYAMFEKGDHSAMSEKLQGKLAKTKEEIRKIIAAL
jgi:hypothetical protein